MSTTFYLSRGNEPNLVATNIKDGVSIYGVVGNYQGSLSGGYDVISAGQSVSGTMDTSGTYIYAHIPLEAIYEVGAHIEHEEPDLSAANIVAGKTILGVEGTASTGELPRTGQTTSYHAGDDGDLETGVALSGGDRWEDNSDNTITDKATRLMWIKNPAAVISGYSGSIGTDLGTWSTGLGSVALRQYVDVGDTSFETLIGSAVTANTSFCIGGDSKYYRCAQSYTVSAYQPGMEDGWATKWTALDTFFEGQESITYTTSDYRISTSNYQLYHCKAGYTTGANPDDPSIDSTHWEAASSASWAEDTSYSVGNIVDVYGSYYICTSAHTATYNRPEDDGDDSHWVECSQYYVCKSAHTAAADKYPGHATYWIAFDSWWLDTWTAISYPLSYPTIEAQMDKCNALTYNTYSDWRMPNILELLSIFRFEDFDFYTGFARPAYESGYVYAHFTSSTSRDTTTRLGICGNFHSDNYFGAQWYITPASFSVGGIGNDGNSQQNRTLFYPVRNA